MEESTYDTYNQARIYLELGDPIYAARILAPVVENEPGSRSLLELLGRAYFLSAQLHRAEATFRSLIELDPVDHWAHIALARTLERQSRHEEAATYRRMYAVMSGGSLD
ncbi:MULTISPECIES: tetratricopeptide repeat protein [Nocardiopsis]|uniref:Tetratricopeptide repeat protein n=2 Tax=Nocardiopsis alba TaxID=53437 RepID=A0A7K2ING5_9ACTN|nr:MULTISPECIES: tetratricopeptide repeat protein [Nocardiopsis]AFR07711.1 TPR repeat family protein [Nocardiopsis alba ATCC BAA-2165]MEC3893889.1 tetratricopeptide repeat protein [Nocardiopsis sp. LDBS1602]MYR31509.1 tetratricopeptide repeat protein [Nocardiopsis alba]